MARIPQDLIYELAEQVNCPLDPLRESRLIALKLAERVLKTEQGSVPQNLYNDVVRSHALILAENDRLTDRVNALSEALRQALNQWRMYAEQDPDFESTVDPTPEGIEYRKCCAVLTRIPKREIEHEGIVSARCPKCGSGLTTMCDGSPMGCHFCERAMEDATKAAAMVTAIVPLSDEQLQRVAGVISAAIIWNHVAGNTP